MQGALLQSLVDFLSYRGPDSRAIWFEGSVGLGHTLLCTTRESRSEFQPADLDGRYWITADARLDGRAELIAELAGSGRKVRPTASDSELILHAYAAWGAGCVEHLRGDFSFAVWDAPNNQLFCARDHFGIKPFYYAQSSKVLVLSNTLNCIRLHSEVSGELDEAAIGDFLLFGLNYDNTTTSFRDVRRLPPAHTLTVSQRGLQIRRYWTPPTEGRVRYARPEDYVENFKSILEAAVADRLRSDRVGILLSGGLDSSSVAAVAKEITRKGAAGTDIRGYTYVYESLIPDKEGEYAREVGKFLGIAVKLITMDEAQAAVQHAIGGEGFPDNTADIVGFEDFCGRGLHVNSVFTWSGLFHPFVRFKSRGAAASMQYLGRFNHRFRRRRGRMMQHHAPSRRTAHIDIRGDHRRPLRRIILGGYEFNDAVYCGKRIGDRAKCCYLYAQPRTTAENPAPRFAHDSIARQPRPAGVDANDFFIVRPDQHHGFEVGLLQRLVKSRLGILWCCKKSLGQLGVLIWFRTISGVMVSMHLKWPSGQTR